MNALLLDRTAVLVIALVAVPLVLVAARGFVMHLMRLHIASTLLASWTAQKPEEADAILTEKALDDAARVMRFSKRDAATNLAEAAAPYEKPEPTGVVVDVTPELRAQIDREAAAATQKAIDDFRAAEAETKRQAEEQAAKEHASS
jgi:hypothetical protein